jgi:hypothetical protein
MRQTLRRRFWAELVLSAASALLLALTLLWQDWIEIAFDVDPDRQNGSAEWAMVVGFVLITVLTSAGAWREWRRAAALRG